MTQKWWYWDQRCWYHYTLCIIGNASEVISQIRWSKILKTVHHSWSKWEKEVAIFPSKKGKEVCKFWEGPPAKYRGWQGKSFFHTIHYLIQTEKDNSVEEDSSPIPTGKVRSLFTMSQSYHRIQIRNPHRETSQFLTKKQPGELREKKGYRHCANAVSTTSQWLFSPFCHKQGENLQWLMSPPISVQFSEVRWLKVPSGKPT